MEKLLSRKDKLRLILYALSQILAGLLDLLAVLFLGILVSITARQISEKKIGDRTQILLEKLGLLEFSPESQVIIIAALTCFLLISKTLISLLIFKSSLRFLAKRSSKITQDLLMRFFNSKAHKIKSESTQEVIYNITSGIPLLVVGILGTVINLVSDVSLLLIMFIGLLAVDVKTSIVTLVIFASTSFVMYVRLHKRSQEYGRLHGKLQTSAARLINLGLLTYNDQVVKNSRFYVASSISNNRQEYSNVAALAKYYYSISKYLIEIAFVCCIFSLGLFVFIFSEAETGLALVAVFVAASSRIAPAVLRIQQSLLSIKSNLGMADSTLKMVTEVSKTEQLVRPGTKIDSSRRGFNSSVQLKDLSFAYDDTRPILKKFSITIHDGEFIGIAGRSGTGKTTLIDLILGNLDPSSGTVLISGKSPQEIFSTFPGAVGYVPQEVFVDASSIRENLTLNVGQARITDSQLWRSLKIAGLDEYVHKLADGLDSKLLERGSNLSGGQKQRLGIARALVTKPKILILDEATSAVDIQTENEILRRLRKNLAGVTTIVVSHRLTTLSHAQRIIYFKKVGEVNLIRGKQLESVTSKVQRRSSPKGLKS